MHKRGISHFSVKIFLTHCTEELRSGTLLCFTKIPESRKVTDRREVSRLPSKFYFLTGPKNS